jgi:CheY-like chemotaxis protein
MRSAKSLLLVDDNPDEAMIIRRALRDLGVVGQVIHATSVEHALEYLRDPTNDKPALILLDLQMPGTGGVEFLEAVKAEPTLAAIPVVVLTNSQNRYDILQSFDLHAAGYIVKPFDYACAVETLKIIRDYWSLSHLPAGHA